MKLSDEEEQGVYLGNGVDMAHNPYNAYQFNDEIHIVYENGYIATEKIKTVRQNQDNYLWTPYIEWLHKCKDDSKSVI